MFTHSAHPSVRRAICRALLVASALVTSAATGNEALAHGGAYRGPPGRGTTGGGPGGPPPGPSDGPSPITAWETWWANNKYLHLGLGPGMRESAGPVTPGGAAPGAQPDSAGAKPEDPTAVRDAQDLLVREAVVPLFIEALSDPSFEVRTAAAVALGKSGDASGLEPLRKAFASDEHQDVRDAAILGLGLLGRADAIPALRTVLADEQATTRHRSFAAFSLGLIGGKASATSLIDYMRIGDELRHREDPQLLASCLVAMGFTGEADVLPVLRRASEDRAYDDQVRAFAILGLGRAADRASIPAFISVIGDAAARVSLRRAATVALGRTATTKDNDALAMLFQALHTSDDPLVRHYAAVAIGGLADAPILAQLRKLFPGADDQDRPFVALALGIGRDEAAGPILRKALEAETSESRRGAISIALGMIGDTGARSVLEAQVKDRGKIWAQGYGALAIGMARIAESAPTLRKELEATNDPRLRANLAVGLGLLHDAKARDWFFATLRGGGTIYERGGAAMALGLLRVNESVPLLVGVWQNRKEQDIMRAYAVVALGVLADPSDPPKLAQFAIDGDYSLTNDPLNEVLSIY
ncbi:MAG: HEAT repeat domain-containing protein [Planctomycetes bacterium]|nr:HEAT repeat domain-containing protein [Planctomycetota bacterium]